MFRAGSPCPRGRKCARPKEDLAVRCARIHAGTGLLAGLTGVMLAGDLPKSWPTLTAAAGKVVSKASRAVLQPARDCSISLHRMPDA